MKYKIFMALFMILSILFFVACAQKDSTESDIEIENSPNVTEGEALPEDDAEENQESDDFENETITSPNESEIPDAPQEIPEEPNLPEEPNVPEKPIVEYVGVTGINLTFYEVSLYPGDKRMPIVSMTPSNATNKGEIWKSSDSAVATVDSLGNIKAVAPGSCTVTVTSVDNSAVSRTVKVTVNTDAECTYIDGILIVNKTYPLPKSYAPGWETEASSPLWEMIAAAKKDGIDLWMTSGYRSYYDQEYIYNGYVRRDGQEEADTYSARPGHSEHQTGLAYDLNDLLSNFGETPEGQWVAENCHKYGFIIRYPKDKEHITGYIYEPWHIRYLGVEKATEVYESGLCLEEFLNITSSYDNVQ